MMKMKMKRMSGGGHIIRKAEEGKRKSAPAAEANNVKERDKTVLRKQFALPGFTRTWSHLHHLTSTTLKPVESKLSPALTSQLSGG